MDTSVSGGMAPALQSTNHQSTDLLNKDANSNGVKEILVQEKINGNAFNEEKEYHTINYEESVNESQKVATDSYAAGDSSSASNLHIEQRMTVKDSFNSVKHKEVKLPETPSTVHVGQGDCPINQNGWNNHKKLVGGGILQESNTGCKHLHNGEEPITKSSKIRGSIMNEGNKSENHKVINEKKPNGQLTSSGSNCLSNEHTALKSADSSISPITTSTNDDTLSSSNDMPPPAHLDFSNSTKNPVPITNDQITSDMTQLTDKSADGVKTSASQLQNNHFQSNVTSVSSSTATSMIQSPISSVHNLPQALKYTDLLNSDLTKLQEQVPNISHKLANTLQELAASLKGTTIQFGVPEQHKLSNEFNNTVTSGDHERHKSVKSLNFMSSLSSPVERPHSVSNEEKVKLQSNIVTATEEAQTLQKRLTSLTNKMDSIRVKGVKKYVKRELQAVTLNKGCTNQSKRVGMHMHANNSAWWSTNFAALTDVPKSRQNERKGRDSTQHFWERVLDKIGQNKDDGKNHSAFRFVGVASSTLDIPKKLDTRPLVQPEIKTEFTMDEQKINFDPIVQLTRVEHAPTSSKNSTDLLRKAKTNTGILQKELDYIQSRCDPDITDSSSDEEIADVAMRIPVKSPRTSKLIDRENMQPSNKKYRKSFCKWVAERAEISKRWTWLQSRISNIEFNIRKQGELYRQLRNAKGTVELDLFSKLTEMTMPSQAEFKDMNMEQTTPKSFVQHPHRRPGYPSVSMTTSTSTSPCNVNQLLNNVHYQTSRLFDNLSPLSSGSPSPHQPVLPSTEVPNQTPNLPTVRSSNRIEEKSMTSARTRPLVTSTFKHRKLVRLLPVTQLTEKLKPKCVPNDSSVMRAEERNVKSQADAFQSLTLRAAMHDHSYHTIISSANDIPLSVTMQAIMKSKRKWCKKPGSSSRTPSQSRSDVKKATKKHRHKKSKHRSHKRKDRRSYTSSMLPPNHSIDDTLEAKRRRLSSQISQSASESGRKRHRGMSFDSDIESSVVIGGFSMHQLSRGSNSGTSTPTYENAGHQTYWKKKKSSEHAYDINNIVIPHGLTSARIEKLAYKEIQTPSWKLAESNGVEESMDVSDVNQTSTEVATEMEDVSDVACKSRHDRYEINEKKKYMAFMEWSISRKGRGSRMSNARGPITPDSVSPTSPVYTPRSMAYSGDHGSTGSLSNVGYSPFATQTSATSPPEHSPSSPTAKLDGIRTRRMSTDQNQVQATTPLSHLQTLNQNFNTSVSESHSSSIWQEGLGSRHGSHESAAHVNRTMSDNVNSTGNYPDNSCSWEIRMFPLLEEDERMLEDVELALQNLKRQLRELNGHDNKMQNGDHSVYSDGEDGKYRRFRPVSRENSGDASRPNDNDLVGRTLSIEALHDHQLSQHSKLGRRRRTDSRASHEDAGRYSDASNASASSAAYRKRKIPRNRTNSQQKRDIAAERSRALRNDEAAARARRKYLHLRLSETDDSSDSDSDSSQSSDGTATSFDDAGHVVDDYADPEWDLHASKN